MSHKYNQKTATLHVQSIAPRGERPGGDFYRTPPEGTRRLLAAEVLPRRVWEPACGDGAISFELEQAGHLVYSTDLYDRGYGSTGIDFLTCPRPKFKFDCIVTNPPFTHVTEFAERALSFESQKVALVARLLWLEGLTRRKFFETSGLARVLVFSGRINIAKSGMDFPGKGMVTYAWYVWNRGHEGPPTVGWI